MFILGVGHTGVKLGQIYGDNPPILQLAANPVDFIHNVLHILLARFWNSMEHHPGLMDNHKIYNMLEYQAEKT